MWVLKSSTGTLFYLHANEEKTVGRKASDIILSNDDSISRRHAIVKVQSNPNLKDDEPTSLCILTDVGSKYGTFMAKGTDFVAVNGKVILSHKDRIKFGLQEHIFTVEYIPILIVTSALSENDTFKLENSMSTIDGIVTTNWINNCTHLTVTQITLTEKVTLALAACVPIVTTDYWLAVECAIKDGAALPHAAQFLPAITEEFINAEATLLNPDEKRKTLFANYTFLYFTMVQYQIYGRMINMAGGKSVLYDEKHLTNKQVCAPHVIIVQYSNTNTTQSSQYVPGYESVCKLLQANNRRLIPEYEIPLALLYCSVRKYCNPTFHFMRLLQQPVKPKTNASQILVGDTQNVFNDCQNSTTVTTNADNTENDIYEQKTVRSSAVCIPETIDVYDSLHPCSGDNTENDIHEKKAVTSNAVYIPETMDAYDSADPCNADNTENDIYEEKTVTSSAVCIPETIDAYDDVGPCSADITENDINKRQTITSNVVFTPKTKKSRSNTELDIGTVCKNESKEHVDLFKNENATPEEIKSYVKDIIPESMEFDTQNVISLETDANETCSTNNSYSKIDSIKSCTINIQEHKLSTIQLFAHRPNMSEEKKNEKYANTVCKEPNKNGDLKRVRLEKNNTDDTGNSNTACYNINRQANHNDRSSLNSDLTVLNLKVNPGRKTFTKIYKLIPHTRILLTDMTHCKYDAPGKKFADVSSIET